MLPLLSLAQANPAGAIGFACCIGVAALGVGILINAVILRAASSWVAKIDLEFGRACLISVAVMVTNFVVSFIIGFALGAGAVAAGGQPGAVNSAAGAMAQVLSLISSFFIASGIYGAMIKDPDNFQPIGFGKGALITLVSYAIVIAIVLVIGAIVLAVIFATGTRLR